MSKYLELVEGSFTQDHFDRQNEYPYVAYSVAEDRVIYSIIKTENGYSVTYLKRTNSFPTDYVEVDLGLPSGKKWLDRNIGASSPTDWGGYFSWGNSEGVLKVTESMTLDEVTKLLIGDSYTDEDKEQVKSDIELGLLEHGKINQLAQYPFGDSSSYNETFGSKLEVTSDKDGNYTVIDNNDKVVAEGLSYEQLSEFEIPLSYDIMYTISNGQYKMPTRADFIELCNNTTITAVGEDGDGNKHDLKFEISEENRTSFNQVNQLPKGVEPWNLKLVNGMTFTANGNSITIPASGRCLGFTPSGGCGLEGGNSYEPSGSSYLSDLGTFSVCWSSSLYVEGKCCQLVFSGGYLSADSSSSRNYGCCVRGLKA